jgi:hypothetical protein
MRQKNRFALTSFGKIQFYIPAFEISLSCCTASGLVRQYIDASKPSCVNGDADRIRSVNYETV